MRRQHWISRLGWIAAVSLLAFDTAGSAWATPNSHKTDVTAPLLSLTLKGSPVSLSDSGFGQKLTDGAVFGVVPGNPGNHFGWLKGGEGLGTGSLGGGFAPGPAIPEPSAALVFAAGALVVGRRLRIRK